MISRNLRRHHRGMSAHSLRKAAMHKHSVSCRLFRFQRLLGDWQDAARARRDAGSGLDCGGDGTRAARTATWYQAPR